MTPSGRAWLPQGSIVPLSGLVRRRLPAAQRGTAARQSCGRASRWSCDAPGCLPGEADAPRGSLGVQAIPVRGGATDSASGSRRQPARGPKLPLTARRTTQQPPACAAGQRHRRLPASSGGTDAGTGAFGSLKVGRGATGRALAPKQVQLSADLPWCRLQREPEPAASLSSEPQTRSREAWPRTSAAPGRSSAPARSPACCRPSRGTAPSSRRAPTLGHACIQPLLGERGRLAGRVGASPAESPALQSVPAQGGWSAEGPDAGPDGETAAHQAVWQLLGQRIGETRSAPAGQALPCLLSTWLPPARLLDA